MKKTLALLLCLLLALSLTACGAGNNENDTSNNTESVASSADNSQNDAVKALEKQYTGLTKDDLKWDYNSQTKTLIFSGKGPMMDYAEDAPAWDKYNGEAEKVVIGDEITAVGAAAFYGFSALQEVKLGQAVEFVGENAFFYCIALRTVNFPASLKYVGAKAFYNDLLHSENGFTFPEGMLYIGFEAFHSAFKENTVFIPASLTEIADGAFSNMFVAAFSVDENNPRYASVDGVFFDKDITTLINYPADKRDTQYEVPNTVTTIRKDAIETTTTLEKIVIPASVSSIEEGAIFWNYALTSVEVAAENSNYKAENGVLFTKDGKTLLCYPCASDRTEYTVPQGTERLGNYAMSLAKNLKELHIGEGLTAIGNYGLFSCENLQKLGWPKSLTSIEDQAFETCNALTEIRYAGTSAEWKKVTIGKDNDLLTDGSVRVFCQD